MPQSLADQQSGFRHLNSHSDEDEDVRVTLILIPGLGTLPPEEWKFASDVWLEGVLPKGTKAQLLAFDHHIQIDDRLSWQRVFDEGNRLLGDLELLRTTSEYSERRPILFVCHSLGGIILKQGLRNASFQEANYAALINLISGIVFLGTPHAQDEPEMLRSTLDGLLSCCSKHTFSKVTLWQLHGETSMLCDVAKQFYDMTQTLDILSCFEERETRAQGSRKFSRSKALIVAVDARAATIGATYETVVGLPFNHLDLPRLENDNSKGNSRVSGWLRTIISNLEKNLAERLKQFDISSEAPSVIESNPSSFSAIRKEWVKPGETNESAEAQNASSTMEDVELVPMLEGFSVERKQATLPCFMMSTFKQNTEFCGRKDILSTLDDVLLPRQEALASVLDGMQCVAVWGTGGLGKTEIALQFAFTRREKFDAVFWIRADDKEKLEADFSQITVALGLENSNDLRNPVISRELAKGWLSNPTKDAKGAEASWLIIFDNADDPDILTDYSQMLGTGSILVTSRHPLAKEVFAPSTVDIALEPLSSEESALLLRNLTQNARGRKDASLSMHVGQRLGGLPLAITQMAGIIRRSFMSYTEFLETYEDHSEHGQLHEQEMEPRRPTARGSVASIWAFDDLKAEAKHVLEILTFLDPDCIQERLFTDSLAQLAGLPTFPKTKYAFWAARKELMESSLIRRNEESGDWWIHRVLQDAVRARVSRNPEDLVARFRTAVLAVFNLWPDTTPGKLHSIQNWQRCKDVYPHVLFLRDIYWKHSSLQQAQNMVDFAMVLNKAAWWQYERGNSHSLRPLAELALSICKLCDASRTRDLLSDIYYTLGATGTEANDRVSSLRYNKLFLDGRLKIADETTVEDARLGIAHNQFGVSLMMHGRYAEAMGHFEQATRVYTGLGEFDLQLLALPTANLGLAYWLQGRHDEAAEIIEQGLKDREKRWGPNDTESFRTGRLLHAMGNVKFSQGLLDGSEHYHRKALAHYQSTIGNDHHRTADVCHRVAQHCIRRRELKQARTIIDQALKVWNADKKVYRNEIARTSFLKAKVLARLGENESAAIYFRDATALRTSLLPVSASKADRDLVEDDFDQLVTFWSK